MSAPIKLKSKHQGEDVICIIDGEFSSALDAHITAETKKSLRAKPADWQSFISASSKGITYVNIQKPKDGKNSTEHYRIAGAALWDFMKSINKASVHLATGNESSALAIAEGLWLKNYRFEPYKKKKSAFEIKHIGVQKEISSKKEVDSLIAVLDGIYFARDLVNEPANILTAVEMAKRIKDGGKQAGYKVDIMGRTKIKALKMGGLLAVNQGSTKDPTFSVIEYKPAKPKNKKPIVLVGKGIVYDTGGLSLKPTLNSMDIMKCDMGGAAAVAGAIFAAATAGLPIHIVGLIPATDNQPGPDAYGPGDVITMMDGTTVEVMNTDAEGRLVLADALAYAKKLKPELTIDLATLTGSAIAAIGTYAAALMGSASDATKSKLLEAGTNSWERLVEFPLWDDYENDLKSDIADIKNLGSSPLAGVIIAGKFLERFTDYPWLHIDIAGPAFLPSARGYLPKGATGFGVNLLFSFFKDYK
ncbi:leucyl aminopeptidase family protein [Cryomorpha ignava]|uniref:Leucyl aminopeptidase family protein n=1 Tax=Cryomorpha ignava TaxID=101383 RepID=A0A7K3WS99_9FLAO|nr:leucyl aminopeptidase family protein [Cryomorpha ignava]NEN24553.1 leucyl aminopeptidase family protein [Cryomorpha ignava]